jgi:hypothetical protein
LSLEPYLTTAISASAAIRYPPPAPLAKMAELDRKLAHLRQSRDDEEAAQILEEETKLPDAPKVAALPEIEIPSVVVSDASDTTGSSTDLPGSLPSTAPSSLPASQASSTLLTGTTSGISMAEATRDPYRVLCKPEDFARESTIATVEHEHAEYVRLWEWYARRNADPPRPEEYQSVTFLASMGCEGQEKPCVEPKPSVSTKKAILRLVSTSKTWLLRLLLGVRPRHASDYCFTTSDFSFTGIEDCSSPWTRFHVHRLVMKNVSSPGRTAVNAVLHRQRPSCAKRPGECPGAHTWNIASTLQSVKLVSPVPTTHTEIKSDTLPIEISPFESTTRVLISTTQLDRQYRCKSRSRRKWY